MDIWKSMDARIDWWPRAHDSISSAKAKVVQEHDENTNLGTYQLSLHSHPTTNAEATNDTKRFLEKQ